MPRPPVDVGKYLQGKFGDWLRMTGNVLTEHANFGLNVFPLLEAALSDLKKRAGPTLATLKAIGPKPADDELAGTSVRAKSKIILPGSGS